MQSKIPDLIIDLLLREIFLTFLLKIFETSFKKDDEHTELEYPLNDEITLSLEKIFNKYKKNDGYLYKENFLKKFSNILDKQINFSFKTENIDLSEFLKIIALHDIANSIIEKDNKPLL